MTSVDDAGDRGASGFMIAGPSSILIAWWREGLGGAIVIAYAIVFGTFGYVSAGHNKAFAALISGGPFLPIGLLFLASWWRSRKAKT